MTKPSRQLSADGKRPQSGVDAAAANSVDGATASRPTAAVGGEPNGPALMPPPRQPTLRPAHRP